jgi:hypothetical protein
MRVDKTRILGLCSSSTCCHALDQDDPSTAKREEGCLAAYRLFSILVYGAGKSCDSTRELQLKGPVTLGVDQRHVLAGIFDCSLA